MGQYVLHAVGIAGAVFLALRGDWRGLFLLALIPLALVPFSYARVRLHRSLTRRLERRMPWPLIALGLSCDAIMLVQLFYARLPRDPILLRIPGVMWIGSVWFSAYALLLLLYGILGLARLLDRLAVRLRPSRAAPLPMGDGELSIGRRELLQKAAVFGAAVPFGVSITGAPISYDFRVEHREIRLPRWPRALDGLRIVHLSDIHVGGAMNRERLLQVAALTNECMPDLVLHTGDFLTHRSGDFDAPLYEALQGIRTKHGQWACLGNHDFEDVPRLERRLRDSGVTLLRNRLAQLMIGQSPLEIGGIDYQFERREWRRTYAQIIEAWPSRGTVPRLILNHDPIAFDALPEDCADLVLSGHTHGGHVGVQLSPSSAITVVGLAGYPDQGLFKRDTMRLFVTRCVGFYGYPMRIGIPPEIALLILRAPQTV